MFCDPGSVNYPVTSWEKLFENLIIILPQNPDSVNYLVASSEKLSQANIQAEEERAVESELRNHKSYRVDSDQAV